jgi:predicted Zn-dependent protease
MKSLLAGCKLILEKLFVYTILVLFGVLLSLYTFEWQKLNGNPFKKERDPFVQMRINPPVVVTMVYNKIAKVSGHRGKLGGIYLLPSYQWNAFVNNFNNVYLFYGLIIDLKNQDELAFIISHEVAHVMLGHTEGRSHEDSRMAEYHADMLALSLMQRAGYNPCVVSKLWKRLHDHYGLNIQTKGHPDSIQRSEYTKLPFCGKE